MSELDDELESSLYSDDVNEEVREWIATTFARSTPGLRRKSIARRHTFRSVVQAVKASLYVKRYVLHRADANQISRAVKRDSSLGMWVGEGERGWEGGIRRILVASS